MTSITLALSDDEHPVPGIDCALAPGLFIMHAGAVQQWICELRAKTGNRGLVVIADDEWVNPGGGYESLTVPASQPDIAALGMIRERLARQGVPGGEH